MISYFLIKLAFLQWVVQGAVDVDIGANPSAEGGDEDEGVDDQAVKVVDIVDTFRLQVPIFWPCWYYAYTVMLRYYEVIYVDSTSQFVWNKRMVLCGLQEQPAFDKKQFITFMKRYIKLLTPKLEPEQQELFKKHIEGATKFLLSKLNDLQLYGHCFYLCWAPWEQKF